MPSHHGPWGWWSIVRSPRWGRSSLTPRSRGRNTSDVARFAAIGAQLAPRVDLFSSVWDADPDAEFYGGTARDYYWWLRRALASCETAECIEAVIDDLESGPIEARDFLLGETDVDVLGNEAAKRVAFDRSHFTRIDVADRRRFTPGEALFDDERKQGALPLEKLRLGRLGLGAPTPTFAGGLEDIYAARPRLVLTADVRDTEGYRQRENHPVLLVLRWLRQASVAYAHRRGRSLVDETALRRVLDPEALATASQVAAEIAARPETLSPFLENPRFVQRLNRARARLFQGFTNAEVSRHLYEVTGLESALLPFHDRLEPFLTVTFRKDWTAADLERQRATLPESAAALETLGTYLRRQGVAVDEASDEIDMFHGTRSGGSYRNIATHGLLPSERGLAGTGLYAVDLRSAEYAKRWRQSDGNGYALRLRVDATASFVDLTSDGGKTLLEAFRRLRATLPSPWSEGDEEDALADYLGVAVLKFSYTGAHAYVIKDGGIVRRAEPWSKPLRSLRDVARDWKTAADPTAYLKEAIADDPSLLAQLDHVLAELPIAERIDRHLALSPMDGVESAVAMIETLNRYRRRHRDALPHDAWAAFYARVPLRKMLPSVSDEDATRVVVALAEAWEIFPLATVLEEGKLLGTNLRGGAIERALRERNGWLQGFCDPRRKAASISRDLEVFRKRPLLYVEILEYLERERPAVFDAAGWAAAWELVDFDGPFLRMYLHVPRQRTQGPLLAPAKLSDVLRAVFRIAPKAPHVLDQLRGRLRSLEESRLWAAIDETLAEVRAWTPEHSLFLARVAADLPEHAKVWDVFSRERLSVPEERKLVGAEADASLARLVLEATRGRFGDAESTLRVLRNASAAFAEGEKRLHALLLQVFRRSLATDPTDQAWGEAVGRALVVLAGLGPLPADTAAGAGFAPWVLTLSAAPATPPLASRRLRRWALSNTRGAPRCNEAVAAAAAVSD
jgi:hypothetical protein